MESSGGENFGFSAAFGSKTSSHGFDLSAPSGGLASWTGAGTLEGGSGDGKGSEKLSECVGGSMLSG